MSNNACMHHPILALSKCQNGMSLIEVMVASLVMMISGLAILTLMTNHQKQVKSLEQKLESLALEQSLQRLFAEINSCKCIFQNVSFDGIASGGSMRLKSVSNGCFTGSALIEEQSTLPSSTAGLKVDSIELTNIIDVGSGSKNADFVVNFNSTSLAGPLKSIRIPSMSFSTSANKVDQCLGSLSAEKTCTSMGGAWNNQGCTLPSQVVEPSMICVGMGGNMVNGKCVLTQCSTGTFAGLNSSGIPICIINTGVVGPIISCLNGVCPNGQTVSCKLKAVIAGYSASAGKGTCSSESEGQACDPASEGQVKCLLWSMGDNKKVLSCICDRQ